MKTFSSGEIVLVAATAQLLSCAVMVANANAQSNLQWQPAEQPIADVSPSDLDPATLVTPAEKLSLAVGWRERITMSLRASGDATRISETQLPALGNATPGRSDFLERTEVSTRVNVFRFQNSQLDVEYTKDKEADERAVGVAFDSTSGRRLRFEGQVVRPRHGRMQYLVGMERTSRTLNHGTVTTFSVGQTGNGGLGGKFTTRLDLHGSSSALLLSTSAGDRGADLLLRGRYSF